MADESDGGRTPVPARMEETRLPALSAFSWGPLSPRAWRRRIPGRGQPTWCPLSLARLEETLAGNALISRAILPIRESHGLFRLRPSNGGVCSKSAPPPAWVARVILRAGSVQIAVSPSRSPVVRQKSRPGVTKVRALRPLDPLRLSAHRFTNASNFSSSGTSVQALSFLVGRLVNHAPLIEITRGRVLIGVRIVAA